jgi:hypothetical protein
MLGILGNGVDGILLRWGERIFEKEDSQRYDQNRAGDRQHHAVEVALVGGNQAVGLGRELYLNGRRLQSEKRWTGQEAQQEQISGRQDSQWQGRWMLRAAERC